MRNTCLCPEHGVLCSGLKMAQRVLLLGDMMDMVFYSIPKRESKGNSIKYIINIVIVDCEIW